MGRLHQMRPFFSHFICDTLVLWMSAMAQRLTENVHKFRELVLYICEKCASHPRFGAVKLNKILFYSDFIGYRQFGRPITGVEYQKLQRGPAPRKLLPIQNDMKAQGELVIQPRQLWTGRKQLRPINLRTADLSVFEAREIALVDEIIDAFRDLTADEASDISHTEIGWKAARIGETIPYETIFVSSKPASSLDIEHAAAVEQDCAELLASIA
jgi:hypothetical protein